MEAYDATEPFLDLFVRYYEFFFQIFHHLMRFLGAPLNSRYFSAFPFSIDRRIGAIPPRSTPIPFSTLPQILAPHFTGREKYLREIDTKFQGSMPSNKRVVLWGLEGVG